MGPNHSGRNFVRRGGVSRVPKRNEDYFVWSLDGAAGIQRGTLVSVAASQARAIAMEGRVAQVARGGLSGPSVLVRVQDGEFALWRAGDAALTAWMEQIKDLLEQHG